MRVLHIICVVVFLAVAAMGLEDGSGSACKHSRREVVLNAGVYFDDNDDNLISRDEIQKYWDLLLTRPEKMYTSVAPWVETVDVIMAHCDKDGDGAISLEDFQNKEHCLETCDKLELMSSKIFQRALDRIDEESRPYYNARTKRKERLLQFYEKQSGISFD